ncbi:hypothetical protein AAE02nite_03580 [Adhaeribacter aerolatus]|uniref:Uncharacterized protein n=1 Tax=Adhaeribacter aerolatus TaxID=670289 RepID=A0A512ASK9_9BACT|nr:hypothetical protein [Adhaeribacter aerolatus]GEO02694.1 hypothetical protein AAE02nite_03580 [Adhaeribacter aerolatus]
MLAASINKEESKKKKNLLFADADNYTIPAGEGWNEGYSHSSRFLYIKDVAAPTKNKKHNIWV